MGTPSCRRAGGAGAVSACRRATPLRDSEQPRRIGATGPQEKHPSRSVKRFLGGAEGNQPVMILPHGAVVIQARVRGEEICSPARRPSVPAFGLPQSRQFPARSTFSGPARVLGQTARLAGAARAPIRSVTERNPVAPPAASR